MFWIFRFFPEFWRFLVSVIIACLYLAPLERAKMTIFIQLLQNRPLTHWFHLKDDVHSCTHMRTLFTFWTAIFVKYDILTQSNWISNTFLVAMLVNESKLHVSIQKSSKDAKFGQCLYLDVPLCYEQNWCEERSGHQSSLKEHAWQKAWTSFYTISCKLPFSNFKKVWEILKYRLSLILLFMHVWLCCPVLGLFARRPWTCTGHSFLSKFP